MRSFLLLAIFVLVHPGLMSQGTLLIKSGFEKNTKLENLYVSNRIEEVEGPHFFQNLANRVVDRQP